ncbi:P-loop containing nucleoside triphosphate hydrolase protein [Chaetomium tenue]|uniref:P-loop containing nucleoside triphosphate hydrolase protein n=1 Tax=Chaetomium tenue TaxID=1854479 RepID=A0ACB7P1K9_9PEZI|nr:P-loop containing nucleoside triphosphate hydrolase protein [Chaetomium globosum]
MWRAARGSVCLLCRSAAQPRTALLESAQPWISQRSFAVRRDATRDRPSRMVLSDRVARGPRTDSPRRPRDRPDGPWAGANQTVANVDRDRRRRPPGSTQERDRGTRDRDTRDTRERRPGASRDRDDNRFKALKMQRALTSVPYRERVNVKARISDIESFDQFKLLPAVKEGVYNEVLKGMVDVKPTPVQRLAIPALLGQRMGQQRETNHRRAAPEPKREEFLLAAETGSGKTLAYLLPIINALKVAEADDVDAKAYNVRLEAEKERRGGTPVSEWIDKFEPHPNHARPRAIVLVPTSELVDQVLAASKKISHVAKIKVRSLSSNHMPSKIQRNMYSHGGIDMVVATPHLLADMAHSDPNILSRVHHLVIDEADSLFDRSFAPETSKIVERAMPSLKQLILCSATIPRRLDNYLAAHFPNIVRIATPNLHAIPRRVQLGVIDVSKDPYRNNKLLACADAIWTIGKDASLHESADKDEIDVKRIMVFVNERETTQEVAEYLVSKGIDAIALHRDTPEHRQSEMLNSFTTTEPMRLSKAEVEANKQAALAKAGGVSKRHLPNTKVIVATDLASRGIDTLAVRHVVLYDVPHTTIDFIHRLGRAGRMGRRGRGVVLVGKDDRRDIVSEVKESMFMGQALI